MKLAQTLMPMHLHQLVFILGLLGGLAACSPTPLYKPGTLAASIMPSVAARAPQDYQDQEVIWGGQVIAVTNYQDYSEVEVLAYPLDSSQRPRLKKPGDTRFIVRFAGYVEPLSYPPGAPITIEGRFIGLQPQNIGQSRRLLPQVRAQQTHVWSPQEMQQGHLNFGFGVGVGGGFH